jgi:hypothetical protein
MNRMEILEQLHRILTLTFFIPEAAERTMGLIQEFQHWSPDTSTPDAAELPPPARKPDTPDELLDLLAGISSDPQVEGLSLSQKASTMALLHIAKALQKIASLRQDSEEWDKWAVRNPEFARTFASRLLDAANSTQEPS